MKLVLIFAAEQTSVGLALVPFSLTLWSWKDAGPEDHPLISSEATIALRIAYLNCLTNQLLVDFAHSAGPLLPINSTGPSKQEGERKEGRRKVNHSLLRKQPLIWRCSHRLACLLPPPSLIQASLLKLVWQGLAGSLLGVPVFLHVSHKHTFV